MSVTARVSDIGQTKVKRYRPGKAPEWAGDNDGDGGGDFPVTKAAALAIANVFSNHDGAADVVQKDHPRLRRLARISTDNLEEIRDDHRRIRAAEIVSTAEEETRLTEGFDFEEEDEDRQQLKRMRLKEDPLPDEEEESEYESDWDEELGEEITVIAAMVRPVFIPKPERNTVAERERLEAEEKAREETEKKRMEERKTETKEILVEKIEKEDQLGIIQKNMELGANIGDLDTDDDVNEAEEYQSWKGREIFRIKNDRERREAMLKGREWERKNPKNAAQRKRKLRFMQRYYHKGAFFQSDPDDHTGTVGFDHDIWSVISVLLLERIRWARPCCLKRCRLSDLAEWEDEMDSSCQ